MTRTATQARPHATTPSPTAIRRRRRPRRLLTALSAVALLLAGYTAWSTHHPIRLTASTEIRSTPEQTWQVLTDFAAYGQWNPFMTSAQVTSPGGRLTEGARLRVVMHDDSGDSTFTPEVQKANPGKELRWLGKMGPGWIADGEHRFTIERIGPDRVRLTQSERFTGIAVPFAQGKLTSDTLPQFRAMNSALAHRVESLTH
ncbi:SRPBCC domain-containing protein [Streptomyces sp. NPDC046716]|uniref:SRPBCC domain-containing protein n=1 Tax=Streptomyces sp. NPDC046716 TaxID=3157093 RepID=UPI0033EE1CAA